LGFSKVKIISNCQHAAVLLIRHAESANNLALRRALASGGGRAEFEAARSEDPALSAEGEAQTARVAALLAGEHAAALWRDEARGLARLDGVYCSAMRRAMQTAAPIGAALGVAPGLWLEWFERGGVYHRTREGGDALRGLTREQAAADFPAFELPPAAEWRARGGGGGGGGAGGEGEGWWPGGHESGAAAAARAARAAESLRERCRAMKAPSAAAVAVVSHGDFLNGVLGALLGLPAGSGNAATSFGFFNASLTCVDLEVPALGQDVRTTLRYQNYVALDGGAPPPVADNVLPGMSPRQ